MFCLNCGKELQEGVAFCDGCGAKIGEVAQVDSQLTSEKAPSVKKNKALLIVGVVLVVLGIARVVDILFFKDSIRAFDDGVLTAFEIYKLGISTIGFSGLGAWLIYKNNFK